MGVDSVVDKVTQAEPPDTLWHYTTQGGLLGILADARMRAGDLRFLNDSQEFAYGSHLLVERIYAGLERRGNVDKGLRHEIQERMRLYKPYGLFVISFSEHGDTLSQWRAYAGGAAGYSLGFDLRDCEWLSGWSNTIPKGEWLTKCIYEEREQEDLLDELCRGLVEGAPESIAEKTIYSVIEDVPLALVNVAPTLKHPSFREEAEWRYCIYTGARSDADIQFRAGTSLPVPYVTTDFEGSLLKRLKAVRIGPNPHPDLAADAVRRLLERYGLEGAEVSRSQTPFRNW